MKTSMLVLGILATAALSAPGPAARSQEGPRPLPPEVLGGPSDPQAELRRLFREVEQTLRRIDDQLFDAAAGEADLSGVDAGIDRLLRETEAASRSAVEGIDRILQVASQMNQGGGQSSSSNDRSGQGQGQSQDQGGQSPIDQQPQGQERQERMQGEQAPQQDQGQGQGQEDQQSGQQPQDPGSQPPRDGSASPDEGRNAPGQDPNQGERGARSSAEGADRWGDLPPRVQTIFRNQVNDDLPVRYREWIDRYHRRLNG